MKNTKFNLIASIILVLAILFGTMTAGATDGEITTTTEVTTTQASEETTTEAEETTTEAVTTMVPATDETETTIEETTTECESYYDNDYESEEEQGAYEEGYVDGYYDGFGDAEEQYKDKEYEDGRQTALSNGELESKIAELSGGAIK